MHAFLLIFELQDQSGQLSIDEFNGCLLSLGHEVDRKKEKVLIGRQFCGCLFFKYFDQGILCIIFYCFLVSFYHIKSFVDVDKDGQV